MNIFSIRKSIYENRSIRFLIAGGINTLISYALYFLISAFFVYPIAYSITYMFGIIFSYYISSKFVFQVKMSVSKFFMFPLVYAFQYAWGMAVLALLASKFGVDDRIAMLIVIVTSLPLTYVISRWVLRAGKAS